MAAVFAAAGLSACGGDGETEPASVTTDPQGSTTPAIAFTKRDGDIWLMNADGNGQANLTRTPKTSEITPAWSPDGERIAFSREKDKAPSDIWVMNADGSGQSNLTEGADGGLSPAWSPDGESIAFAGDRGIFVMTADGTGATRLTGNTWDGDPAWSADGQRLVFTRGRLSDDGQFLITDIYAMSADGSRQTRLTTAPELKGVDLSSPTFSPDGEMIAFLGARAGDESPRLWTMNAGGSEPTQLLAVPSVRLRRPAFSPDGERILFVANGNAERPGSFMIVNADGSDARPVPGTRDFQGFVSWSPAG